MDIFDTRDPETIQDAFRSMIEKPDGDTTSSARTLRMIVRWLRLVRSQWTIVAASMTLCMLLGMFYYLTATRMYLGRAELLIQETGPVFSPNQTVVKQDEQGMLPTYERLFQSGVVLKDTAGRLAKLPANLRVDFAGLKKDAWPAVIKRNLVAQTVRRTKAIQIGYRSKSPMAAMAVVHCLVESYTAFIERYYQDVAGEIEQSLRKERIHVAERLRTKEDQLLAAHRHLGDIGMRDGDRMVHPIVKRTIEVNSSLVAVQKERMRLQASLQAIRDAVSKGSDVRQHLLALEPNVGREIFLAALGLGVRDNNLVSHLEQQLMSEKNELASIREHLGNRHPRVVSLSDSVHQSKVYLASYHEQAGRRAKQINDSRLGELLISMVQQKLQQSLAHEDRLSREYDRNRQDAVQIQGQLEQAEILEAEVQRLRNLNKTLLGRIENIDINRSHADVRVEAVGEPSADKEPASPKWYPVLLVALSSGILLGILLVVGRDMLDDRFRSPDELKQELGSSVLAMVRQLPERAAVGIDAIQLHIDPNGVESESFRTLRTNLAFQSGDLSCLTISSPEPSDGKTTILSNLGVAFAEIGKRTLLIDADLRKPGLSKLFGIKGHKGLSDLLRSDGELHPVATSYIQNSGLENLDVLPSGPRPHDPTGLLSQARFSELLSWAQDHYDQVLVDGTPILVASDAAITGRVADGLVLVIQPEKNHRRVVLRAADEIRDANLNLIGLILNRISLDSSQNYGGGYGYGYGYGYGEAYGDFEDSDEESTAG